MTVSAIADAIEAAVADSDRPSLICCKTVIGFGSPNKQGTASTHGAPLGDEEIAAARVELGWNYPPFEIPDDVLAAWNGLGARQLARTGLAGNLCRLRNSAPEARPQS